MIVSIADRKLCRAISRTGANGTGNYVGRSMLPEAGYVVRNLQRSCSGAEHRSGTLGVISGLYLNWKILGPDGIEQAKQVLLIMAYSGVPTHHGEKDEPVKRTLTAL
jgi:hypothetical protein